MKMRSILLLSAACLTLTLPACVGTVLPASPSAVCDRTTMDESGGQLVELGYRLFRTAGEIGVDAGKIKGPVATRVAKADNRIFAATQAVQSAYAACNAVDYAEAIAKAKAALSSGNDALPK